VDGGQCVGATRRVAPTESVPALRRIFTTYRLQTARLPKMPPFVPIHPSGVDDISDDSQDSHILILIILIVSHLSLHFSINYKL
jgi:hypothetical protein